LSSSLTNSTNVNRFNRAKTATRPACRSRIATATTTTTTPTPNGETNDKANANEYVGLSNEEIRILRTIKEESRQRGGFVRIFPTSDTFEFFSSFFEQRTTSFNQMIHQRLYPSRWTNQSFQLQNNSQIRRTTVPRSKHLSVAFHSNEFNANKGTGCDLDEALQRYEIYERRLIDIIPLNDVHFRKDSFFNDKTSPTKANQIDLTSKRLTTVAQVVKQQTQINQIPTTQSTDIKHSTYTKNDLFQMIQQGLSLRFSLFSFRLLIVVLCF